MNDELFNISHLEAQLEMKAYTADFETTTDPNDCRVWAWAICEVNNPDNVMMGNSMDSFMYTLNSLANCWVYFHNLAFDGNFLLNYLMRNGWEWVAKPTKRDAMCFGTCISDNNQFYSIDLVFSYWRRVHIYDSLKVIPLSIKQVAKAFKLPEEKGELDYEAYREVGHILTDEERDYIRRDVQIAAQALKVMLGEGMSKMTAGSNALSYYKQLQGGHRGFRKIFPYITEEQDTFMRRAYRGGFTYCNPKYQGRVLGNGIVLDVNSLYPSVMHACDGQLLPHGKPSWFDGSPNERTRIQKQDKLWIACATLRFKIKPDHIPTIQIKNNMRFKQTEYLTDSGAQVTISFTNVDWELMNMQYDVQVMEWHGGFCFQGSTELFKEYVDYWTDVKIKAGKDGNAGMRQIAKLQLNSLYGKFATRRTCTSRKPVLDEDGAVRYVDLEPETRDGVYLPAGIFITAYARYKTITAAQSVYDRFVYADTDSLHLLGTELPTNLDIDEYELGKWAHEATFTRAKFLRAKGYIEETVGSDTLTVHVAGMPAICHPQVTFDNFEIGAVYQGKLYQKKVSGGIILQAGEMKIRENL